MTDLKPRLPTKPEVPQRNAGRYALGASPVRLPPAHPDDTTKPDVVDANAGGVVSAREGDQDKKPGMNGT